MEQLQREKEEAERKAEADEFKRLMMEMKQKMEQPDAAVAGTASSPEAGECSRRRHFKALKKMQKKMAAELQ